MKQDVNSVQQNASTQQELGELRASMTAQSEKQVAELNDQLRTVRQQLRESTDSLNQQKSMSADLQTRLNSIQQSKSNQPVNNQPLVDLQNQVQQYKTENASLAEQLNSLQESQRTNQEQLGAMEARNQQLNQELQQAQAQNNGLNGEVTRLTDEMMALTPAASESDDSGLRNQLAAATRFNEQQERRVVHSKSKIKSLTTENEQLKRENQSLSETQNSAANVSTAPLVDTSTSLAANSVVPSTQTGADVTDADASTGSGTLLWPVKYWIMGLMLIGLAVALAVAWAEGDKTSILKPVTVKDSD